MFHDCHIFTFFTFCGFETVTVSGLKILNYLLSDCKSERASSVNCIFHDDFINN